MRGLLLVMAVSALASAALPARALAQAQTRPNVVFVMTDDQTPESMKVMTKTREGIARAGTTFTRMIATYPLCCPSRSTYLTGQYSHNHGVVNNVPPFGGYARLPPDNLLPVWLQRAGYRTMHVGRYLNGYGTENANPAEIPPGWSDWLSTIDPTTYDYAHWQMNENGTLLDLPGPSDPTEYQTDYLGRRASELVAEHAPSDQPFFLSLTFPAPHSGRPVDPDDPPSLRTPSPAPRHRDVFSAMPLPFSRAFDEADVSDKPGVIRRRPRLSAATKTAIKENYQQELESLLSVDDAVGRLLDTLARTGELSNTLVIFTSDNGFFHGEHRVPAEKVLPYEPSIRVPMMMRGPGVPAGRTLSQLVGNIDWAPTILDAADAEPGRVQDGRSLFALAEDPTKELGRELVLENGRGVGSVSQYRGLRNNRFAYIRSDRTGERQLYDLRRDPAQLRNVFKDKRYRKTVKLLARRLRSLERCRGASCRRRPAVRLSLRHGCLTGRVRLAIGGRENRRIGSVRYLLDGRRVRSSRRAPYRAQLSTARLAAAAPARLRARVAMRDGRVVTLDRTPPPC
jgi:N-acetylglucosamine-6-sulfatase